MKNLYAIYNKAGVFLCHQVDVSEKEAVRTARVYYGAKGAYRAEFVRAAD